MGGDDTTLDFYTREAARYADFAATDDATRVLKKFTGLLPKGCNVLDFGCGPGWAAGAFQEQGFKVQGFDGSVGLAEQARERYGIPVTVGRFEEFNETNAYDAIWASFCLLHDKRAAMPGHLARLCAALRPGGAFYLGLKEGEGEERDNLDRFYTYYSEPEIRGLLGEAGFKVDAVETEPSTGFSGEPCTSMHIFAHRD